jgi:hypothetical protein
MKIWEVATSENLSGLSITSYLDSGIAVPAGSAA